jgi:hypothetical protein
MLEMFSIPWSSSWFEMGINLSGFNSQMLEAAGKHLDFALNRTMGVHVCIQHSSPSYLSVNWISRIDEAVSVLDE